MGNGSSKEEQLYQAVQNGNTNAVKALRHDGAELEVIILGNCCSLSLLLNFASSCKIKLVTGY